MHRDRHVERDAVVVRRLGRCELFESLIAGERRPALRRVGPTGQSTVPRELDHDVGSNVLGALFERARSLSVQADAKRSAEVGVQRIGDERVHEPRRSPHRPAVDQESGARRGIERFDHDGLRKPDHVDEYVFGELDAEHRRRSQDARRIGAERADPAPHDVAQARRYIILTRGRQVRCGDARIVQAARLDPVPDELRRVERIPGGLHTQRGGNAARLDIAGNGRRDGDQIGQLVVVESGELHTSMLAAFEIGQRGSQFLRRVLTRFPAAGDNENRRVGQRVRDVTQQQQRSRLCPLEVVEHQHERPRRRDAAEEIGRGLEHEESFGGVVGHRRVRSGLYSRGELGADPHELATTPRDMLGQEADRCVFDAVGQHATERLERYPGLVASPVHHGRIGRRLHRLRERRQQGGLADAGFASQYHAAQSRTPQQREFLGERVQLVRPADEAGLVRQRARERDRDGVDRRSDS